MMDSVDHHRLICITEASTDPAAATIGQLAAQLVNV